MFNRFLLPILSVCCIALFAAGCVGGEGGTIAPLPSPQEENIGATTGGDRDRAGAQDPTSAFEGEPATDESPQDNRGTSGGGTVPGVSDDVFEPDAAVSEADAAVSEADADAMELESDADSDSALSD